MNADIDQATIGSALEPVVLALAADGYSMSVSTASGRLRISITAGPEACEDCLVPKNLMAEMIAATLARARVPAHDLDLSYPNEA
jgi:hypothetical protein